MNYLINETPPFLEKFFSPFDELFNRPNQREPFRQYSTGWLAEIKRKKIQALGEPTIESRSQALPHFLHEAPWDEKKLNEPRRDRLEENRPTKSRADGYLILDDTGNPKSGPATFAPARPDLGRLGKVATGPVVVTSPQADASKDWPLDLEPYGPHKGVQEENPRREPDHRTRPSEAQQPLLTFHPKWELALRLVEQATPAPVRRARAFSHSLVDGWYGHSPRFIQGLEEKNRRDITSWYQNRRLYYRWPTDPAGHEHYLKDVVTALVKESESLVRVEYLTASRPKRESWVRDLERKVKNRGWRRVLLCQPTARETDLEPMEVLMTNDKDRRPAERLRAWSFRDRIDQFQECAKDTLGFDQQQVRWDRPMRRHWYLVFLRYWYLIYHRQKGSFGHGSKKKAAPPEKCSTACGPS